MTGRQTQLVLVRASKSRPDGRWSDDDFDVREGSAQAPVIGRILKTPAADQSTPWFWTITARIPNSTADRGYAATREAAMAAFKVAWIEG